ncbi:MAG: beta-mannosidase [Bacteroidales bacterium]|nr:beta-mannosidase [Bacteroidales bacterium]
MKTLKLMTMIATAIAFTSCGEQQGQTPAESLIERLNYHVSQGQILFGHQDSYLYGHSWKVEKDVSEFCRSDIHDVCGRYPAIYGMDLGGIELDSQYNIDNNDFNHMRESAIAHHLRGGIITFSWHPRNPLTGGDTWDNQSSEVVASILPGGENHGKFMEWLGKAADYLASFKAPDGKAIPIIFRPWHEHTRDWFWWGQNLCTKEQYIALWRMTYDYMTDKRGLDNLVWSYSPDAGGLTDDNFGEKYPGDDIVDMVGIDFYQFDTNEDYIERTRHCLSLTEAFAKEHGKLMAFTEAGFEGVKYERWWTEVLYPAIKDFPVSYVLLWRNACDGHMQHHFYGPHPEHESAEDFKAFAAEEQILFLE